MADATRPALTPNPETEPYWEAAGRRELVLPRCSNCGEAWFPPSAACPSCSAFEHEWAHTSGRGEVVTYTVVHRAPGPAFAERVPYVLAVIELAEGPRLLTNVLECPPGEVQVGMPVEVTFEEIAQDVVVPQFRPRKKE